MDFKTLLVLACVAAGCLAGPVRETYCSEECNSRGRVVGSFTAADRVKTRMREMNGVFTNDDEGMFRAFKSYYFSYAVDIDSRINGANGDQSSTVHVRALAIIEGLSACEMMLKLTDISIMERSQDGPMVAAETSTTFSETLMAHPLRFSMEGNGTITSVCPEAGEEIWALNVKRGFLSHIQTKRTTSNDVFGEGGVFETSVTGTCMPVYSSTGSETFLKTNDYLMCKHRTNLNMFVDAIPVHLLAPTASPLSSRMECSYVMDTQGISSVECHEIHTLKPFAESDSKPETVVHTVITKVDVRPSIDSSLSSEFTRRTSLLYEDPVQVSTITSDDVRSTITQICESVTNGVSAETPGLFETLTKQFGELDTDNMNTVINRLFRICPQVETNEVINMVKDALTDCDTEQCAQGFHSIIRTENSAENEFYLRKWFMKLVFHKNPTKNMINLVHSYVHGNPEVNLPSYYALSSMIHQYCRMSDDDCSKDGDILNAAIIFEDNLHDSCLPESDDDQKKILMSLRAIGNMGLIQRKNLLNRCNREQNPAQLRVAAVDAYRRASCNAVPTERFMGIFRTIDNDSELRIAAYRAIIRCPSEELLQGIADTMAVEPTNQVTCYVSSHLANLRNSQDPMVYDLQTALSQSPLANVTKCGMDYRKFSHNYGLSYFDDESGNGIHFDSDVVFSSKSYLPRSARLAMNVDLFGYGFDLFELDTRLEGWQEAFESVMIPDEDEREANLVEKVKRIMNKRVYRQKREGIKNTALNKIKKEYESSHDSEQLESEKASLAMKILGNDVFYKDQDDFQRMAEMFSKERIMEIITSLASQRTHEYSLNKNLKTSKVTIPTMAGMPLEVNIQGAFNTILKASGKLDVMGMMATPRRMTIQGLFEPSAAIEIHSNMMVDAHSARSGLSHKTTLASSLSLGGSLSFENGMLRAKVTAPPRRETIISASSSLYFMQRNELVPVSEPEDAVRTVDETLSNPRYNLHISGVRPNVPFALPEAFFHNWALEVTLDKLEENLVSYDLEAGFRTDKAFRNGQIEKTDHIHFLIGAPTSETIGAFSMDLAYHRSNATLIINTESPKGSTYFIGSLRNETNSKRLHIQQTVSGQTFVFEAGMDTVPLTNGLKFVPVFMVTVPNVVSYTLQGHVSCTGEEKVWDLSLIDGAEQKLAALRGDLTKNNTMRRMTLAGNFGSFSGSLQGGYRIEETSSSIMITPIFSLNSPFPPVTLSIGGGPLVISDNGVTMNELYLTTTNTRLIEVSNLHLEKRQRRFGFQGKIKETIPFGIEFDMTNVEQREYSVDLTLTSIIGDYNVRGLLFNRSSDFIYRLEVITSVNNTEYFNVTTEFKNEINTHQYLDTIIRFRGQQIYRTKNGLQTQALSAKTRYTPIFMLETNQLGMLTSEGSFDVSESGILINNMALIGTEDIFRLSGSASVDRDARIVRWSLNVGGAYITEVISGSASHRDNQVLFQTSLTSESSSQPDYSLTIDLQNSTTEGAIFSWDGKVELDMPHHRELSFRMDTEYTLTPGHSSGNVFRLCYDGIDCTSTEKRITLSHDLTFNHDKENNAYSHDMEVTYTHPAVDKDITFEWTTSCTPNITSGTQLTLKDHGEDLFTTTITYIPEGPSRNGSTSVLLRAPGYFDYEFTDTFHFSNLEDIFWLSKYRSGQEVMSFLVRFNITSEGPRYWTSTVLEYTDIRNNAFTLEYVDALSDPGNKLNSMTIKKNSDLKMLMFEETTLEISEPWVHSRCSRILKTTFQPVQDLSYNQTATINLQNGNVHVDMQLRFMPGQKPISLITDFTNRSTDAKKEGQIITTLSLPKTSITVLTEGKLEKGVPSGNLSIKFQPLSESTETYAMEFAMKNRSSSPNQMYDSALIFKSPGESNYGLKHTVEWSEGVFFPMTSSLTGFWRQDEVTVGSTLTYDLNQNSGELDLSLTIPDHVYLFSGRFDMDSNSITISKDSNPIFSSSFSQDFQESQSGYTYSLEIREAVMSYGSETTVTLSKASNAYDFNLQIQENNKEALYTDVTLDLFPGQVRFDLATEARSDYLPGYNTKINVDYEKTELVHTFGWTLKVEDTKVFGVTFSNSSSTEEPNSRVTRLTFTQPTNPDVRLRTVVLTDSCSMSRQRITHNTTLMWGSQLPIETIAFSFIGNRNDAGSEATLMLLNEGRVFGFGRWYTLALGKTRTGTDQTGSISVRGETGNIFSLETELTNSSRDYMTDYETSITMNVLDRHPITIESSLVHNSMSDNILDADLIVTYSMDTDQRLTAGIEVTRVRNGHSVVMDLHHLVNSIDVTLIGTYSNSPDMFEMTLENNVLLGDERHQPELTFSLNRRTKEVSFMYTGSENYGFYGQFLNMTNDDGRVYEINCRNTYSGGRVVPYSMIFNEPRRLVGMMVQYNPENPEDNWDFTAGYKNDTAIFASLDTVHSGQTIHNGSIVLSLDNNVPKVLTTQIKWEPSWPQDLKAAVLNIMNKTKALRDEKRATMCRNWRAIAERMNRTMTQFLMSNVNIYTQMMMLKTQVETQWALNQPFRMGQLRFLTEKWMRFNQTVHANLLSADFYESSRAYLQFAAEFEDIKEFFSSGFNMFSEDVLIDWVSFEEALTAIKDQFDGEAIATHWHASMEARDAFFNNLWVQFEEDIVAMDPNWDALKNRVDTIGQNLKAIGPRISEEFMSRIAALNYEKMAIQRIIAAIVEDIQAFNATLRGAVARWEQAVQRELEPFRNTDFSWAVNLVREINETIRTLVNEEEALWHFQMTSQKFKAPYAEILTRGRRQAPGESGRRIGNLDNQNLMEALAKFSSFGKHNTPSHVNIPSIPNIEEVEEVQKSACNFTAILNVLKKVFSGTYELSKLDLVNGEIIFKIFVKDFSNYTSLTNLTRQYLDMLPLDVLKKINITKVEKMISMLHEGSLSEFKARFMEQFTANRTYYEELMQELKTRMETQIQNEVESRVIPYLESMGDRIVEGGRPFFGRLVDLPDQEERQSFLRQLTSEMDIAGLERMMGRMKQTMCGVVNTMSTAASRVKMATCPHSWMPPYKANALVIGAKHYMTFDKQFYDFSGKCGYLLAKDFVHENDFSAIVDYERDMDIPIRNMMFMINSTTFEIKSDGTVRVNRQPRELPLQVDDTAIVRVGDSIFLKNAHGVSVVCKLPHDVCVLKLKGQYFDRTAGLLGNFNFEPYDDFKTPGNVLQTNITSFTESWKVGKNCIQSEATSLDRNRVIPSTDRIVNFDPLHPENQACASMFLDNCSPLARCHGAVDPDSFYRMCILDTSNLPEEEQHTKRCSIAAAYKTQCWYAKNPVGMPEECITCKVGEEPFKAGKPVTIEGDDVPRLVDIVFVVEEKRCNQQNARNLDNLVFKLAGELQDAGYNNTQFGLAAFGGSGVHDAPHPHTINHKIFNNKYRDFPLGRDSLEFADDGSNDTFAAIKLAANYPFRAGAAKHIILLSCSEFEEEDTRLSFEELSVMLRKRAISLTMLMDYQFRLNKQSKSYSKSKSKSKSEQVYGIDTKSTYTSKMAGLEIFKGSSTLRQYTNEPEGRCALLAQESGGAIFDSSMLGDKGFNEVFVKRLVMKSEPEQCQVCRCVPDDMVGVGRSVCEKCINPLNVFGEEIRAGLRAFELKHGLPHWRYDDQIPEEEE